MKKTLSVVLLSAIILLLLGCPPTAGEGGATGGNGGNTGGDGGTETPGGGTDLPPPIEKTSIVWESVTSTSVEVSSIYSSLEAITIDDNFITTPAEMAIIFDASTTDAQKIAVLKNTLLHSFSGVSLAEGVKPLTLDSIDTSFTSASRGSLILNLHAKDGYEFQDGKEVVRISVDITGDFLQPIDMFPIVTKTVANAKYGKMDSFTVNLDFSLSPNPIKIELAEEHNTISERVDATGSILWSAFYNISLPKGLDDEYVSDSDINVISSTTAIVPKEFSANPGYMFPDGSLKKIVEIPLVGKFKNIIDWQGITTTQSSSSAQGSAQIGSIVINNMFEATNTVNTVINIADYSKNEKINALKNGILQAIEASGLPLGVELSLDDIEIVIESLTSASAKINFRPSSSYAFSDESSAKEVIVPLSGTFKNIIDWTGIKSAEIVEKESIARISEIAIDEDFNMVATPINVYFHWSDITPEQNKIAIKNGIIEIFKTVAFPDGVKVIETTDVGEVEIDATNTLATTSFTLYAMDGFVFPENVLEKTFIFSLNGGYVPPVTTYYVAENNSDDRYTGTEEKPFASVQKAIDVIQEYNRLSDVEMGYTIVIDGRITETGSYLHEDANYRSAMVEIRSEKKINISLQGKSSTNPGILDASNAVISEGSMGGMLVFATDDSTIFLMDNLTITGGKKTKGSGAYIGRGSVFMDGTHITENKSESPYESSSDGSGAVYIDDDAFFEMRSGRISHNTARDNGGGVYVEAQTHIQNADKFGKFIFKNGIIDNNYAGNDGGGIYAEGIFIMENGNITHNTAEYAGGGIYISCEPKESVIKSGVIAANKTLDYSNHGGGAGIYIRTWGYLEMENGVIGDIDGSDGIDMANVTPHDGGGVYVGGEFVFHDGYISGNRAGRKGGGIYSDTGSIHLYSGLVGAYENEGIANTAVTGGGGIFVFSIYSGTIEFKNDPIVFGNTANSIQNNIEYDQHTRNMFFIQGDMTSPVGSIGFTFEDDFNINAGDTSFIYGDITINDDIPPYIIKDGYENIFMSDNGLYKFVLNKDGNHLEVRWK